jgi:methylenetetrahydrofolate--tRNA-(uracil-5-)-methyltransferase
LAARGIEVELFEMKPKKRTPAQVSDHFAELVCSNSFRSRNLNNAVGLIKEEMRRLGGFLIGCADACQVPAGDALAVDRHAFSKMVEHRLKSLSNLHIVREEIRQIPNDNVPTIIATGPLTSDDLAADIVQMIGTERLAFYDAISPIIEADSIDMEHAFWASRFDKGQGADYLNCSLNEAEYDRFYDALVHADTAAEKDFEKLKYFEGCLPIEEMARRGKMTLLFGPFKPVGIKIPGSDKRAHAVIQLRREDIHGTSFNLVGCQTRLSQPAQKEVFRLIPALKNATFLRFGAIHRNTYLNAPDVLGDEMQIRDEKARRHTYFSGQITGVEGYVESMSCGLLTSFFTASCILGKKLRPPPATTMLGGLYRHTRGLLRPTGVKEYSPSNVTWSMVEPLEDSTPGAKRFTKNKDALRQALVERALTDLSQWVHEHLTMSIGSI